eukprot:121679_1
MTSKQILILTYLFCYMFYLLLNMLFDYCKKKYQYVRTLIVETFFFHLLQHLRVGLLCYTLLVNVSLLFGFCSNSDDTNTKRNIENKDSIIISKNEEINKLLTEKNVLINVINKCRNENTEIKDLHTKLKNEMNKLMNELLFEKNAGD